MRRTPSAPTVARSSACDERSEAAPSGEGESSIGDAHAASHQRSPSLPASSAVYTQPAVSVSAGWFRI